MKKQGQVSEDDGGDDAEEGDVRAASPPPGTDTWLDERLTQTVLLINSCLFTRCPHYLFPLYSFLYNDCLSSGPTLSLLLPSLSSHLPSFTIFTFITIAFNISMSHHFLFSYLLIHISSLDSSLIKTTAPNLPLGPSLLLLLTLSSSSLLSSSQQLLKPYS